MDDPALAKSPRKLFVCRDFFNVVLRVPTASPTPATGPTTASGHGPARSPSPEFSRWRPRTSRPTCRPSGRPVPAPRLPGPPSRSGPLATAHARPPPRASEMVAAGGGWRMVPAKPQGLLQRRPEHPGEEGELGHGGLTADQPQQGQAQDALKGMPDSPRPTGSETCSRHLNRDSAASISTHSHLLFSFFSKPSSQTLQSSCIRYQGLSILKEQKFRGGPEPPEACSCSVAAPPRYWLPRFVATAPVSCCARPPSPGAPTRSSPGMRPLSWSRPARNAAGSRSPNGSATGTATLGAQPEPDSNW